MQSPDDDAWSHESQGRSSEHEGNKKKRIRIAVVVVDAVILWSQPHHNGECQRKHGEPAGSHQRDGTKNQADIP